VTARILISAFVALSLLTPSAFAQDVLPLAGEGENIQPIARVKVPRANEVEMAGDWAFVSTDEGEGIQGGLTIVNIADPTKPFVQGKWNGDMSGLKKTSFGDVDLSTDGNLAFITNAHGEVEEGVDPWVVIIDTSDKSKPKMIGQIVDDADMDYVHTSTLDGKTLYTNPQVAAFYPQTGNAVITMWDVSNPAKPVKKGELAPPSAEAGLSHDSYIDHRPDGKTMLYGASIHQSHVMDITNPMAPNYLQTQTGDYTISHDLQPNHDRTILVLDDEGAAGGQLDEAVSVCGKAGTGPASLDSGSVHFYAAAPDGTFANGGAVELGSFNAPTNVNTGACVAHVFWQAPDENRMTQAYYRTGAFIVDFDDPANAKQLGVFHAEGGANYWSNKPHRGYLFASDQSGHLDVLKYIGEGGKRWPATAGPAEIQRAKRQGVPYVPIGGAANAPGPLPGAGPSKQGSPSAAAQTRATGKFSLKAKVKRVPGKKGKKAKLTLRFFNAKGKRVAAATVKKAAGKKATLKVSGVAVAGKYTYAVFAGKKRVAKGKFTVKRKAGTFLSPNATLTARAK
jgi:hypothetical protein